MENVHFGSVDSHFFLKVLWKTVVLASFSFFAKGLVENVRFGSVVLNFLKRMKPAKMTVFHETF